MKRAGPVFLAPISIGFSILAAAFVCAFGLLGTIAPAQARTIVRFWAPPVQPDRTIAGHLYVAGSQFSSQTFVGGTAGVQRLMRYPLVNGKPGATPDLSFPTKTDGPMAIDKSGNVYSAADCMTINVFPPNKNTILRTLHVNLPCGDHVYFWTVIRGLAVDSNGYLFVSTHEDCFSCSTPIAPQLPPTGNPLTDCKQANYACTLVYAPGASGNATPLFLINAGYYSNGMALDAAGRLFLEPSQSDTDATSVNRWSDVDTNPTLGKTMSGAQMVAPTGLAIDYSQNFFVNSAKLTGSGNAVSSYIARYLAYWSGTLTPLAVFQTNPAKLFWFGIGVDSGWLYTGSGQQNLLKTTPTLMTFRKGSNGNVAPTYSQTISLPEDPEYLAVGP